MTNKNTNPAATNFRAPINVKANVKMPISINFRAPITLTYNGAESNEPLEKVNAADLQRYIEERLQGQCETVPAGWPKPIKPAKSCNAPTDNAQIDNQGAKGLVEATADTLAEAFAKEVDLYLGDLLAKAKELEAELGDSSAELTPLEKPFKELIEIRERYLKDHIKCLELKKKYNL